MRGEGGGGTLVLHALAAIASPGDRYYGVGVVDGIIALSQRGKGKTYT